MNYGNKSKTSKKFAYTVFLEPAIGDWAWVKNADDETMYVGSCVSAGDDWYGHAPISKALIAMVDAWVSSIRPLVVGAVENSEIDWAMFNERGIAIARQLKLELGNDVEVRYVKPGEDPSSKHDEGFAILNDGSVVKMTRKPNNVSDD